MGNLWVLCDLKEIKNDIRLVPRAGISCCQVGIYFPILRVWTSFVYIKVLACYSDSASSACMTFRFSVLDWSRIFENFVLQYLQLLGLFG